MNPENTVSKKNDLLNGLNITRNENSPTQIFPWEGWGTLDAQENILNASNTDCLENFDPGKNLCY